jgi:hypothetical protein
VKVDERPSSLALRCRAAAITAVLLPEPTSTTRLGCISRTMA